MLRDILLAILVPPLLCMPLVVTVVGAVTHGVRPEAANIADARSTAPATAAPVTDPVILADMATGNPAVGSGAVGGASAIAYNTTDPSVPNYPPSNLGLAHLRPRNF